MPLGQVGARHRWGPQHTLPCLEPRALNPHDTLRVLVISRTSASPFTVPFGSGRPGPSARVLRKPHVDRRSALEMPWPVAGSNRSSLSRLPSRRAAACGLSREALV